MARYFVPYAGKQPAAVEINGHRVLILSGEEEFFEPYLESLGADSLKKVKTGPSKKADERALERLAARSGAGVVVAPPEASKSNFLGYSSSSKYRVPRNTEFLEILYFSEIQYYFPEMQ